jgi:RNA polymerase sigma factor (sigma-70 family)
MSKLSIETLKLATQGNNKAKSDIIRQYMPLVHKMVYTYKFLATGGTVDDMVQEGRIAINYALDTFNPPGEVTWESWMTWVYHKVRHGVQSAARKESRHLRFHKPNQKTPDEAFSKQKGNRTFDRVVTSRKEGLYASLESECAPWLDPADSGVLNYEMEPAVPTIEQIVIDGCGSLDSVRAQIVCKRFGLMGHKPKKAVEIASDLSMSKQSVSGYLSRFSKAIREKHPELKALIS